MRKGANNWPPPNAVFQTKYDNKNTLSYYSLVTHHSTFGPLISGSFVEQSFWRSPKSTLKSWDSGRRHGRKMQNFFMGE